MSELKAVAFDIIETVFSLEALRPRLEQSGLGAQALETWFARSLRDAFALAAAGCYAPFREVMEGALRETFADRGRLPPTDVIAMILDGMSELEVH